MKTVKFSLWLLALTLIAGQASRAQTKTIDKDLPNFAQVNAKLYRGAQPTESGIKKLAALGVKTVIDLRGADERAKKEEVWARNAGIKFINLPLGNWNRPKSAQILEIEKLLNAPENQPVFIHCKRGADRTGTVIAIFHITHDGWDAKRANEDAEKYGFGWWQFKMKDFIKDFYRDYKKLPD